MNHPAKIEYVPWEERKTVRPREVAERTGLSLSTIYDAMRDGSLPARKISPKVWVLDPKDVDAWLDPKGDTE